MATEHTVDVFADSIRLDIHELVRELNENVGATVVAAMTGAGSRTLPYKWAKDVEPQQRFVERLRLGYRVWRVVKDDEGVNIALSWLMGANPRLGETTPVSAIRELRTQEVVGAAEAFIAANAA